MTDDEQKPKDKGRMVLDLACVLFDRVRLGVCVHRNKAEIGVLVSLQVHIANYNIGIMPAIGASFKLPIRYGLEISSPVAHMAALELWVSPVYVVILLVCGPTGDDKGKQKSGERMRTPLMKQLQAMPV